MSDHFSGPRAIADPAADIADLYVFPSPERPGYLVLVMTVFPAAMPGALFSDAVAYRFRLRPVTLPPAGAKPGFEVGQTEYAFTCIFAVPIKPDGSEAWVQTGTCTTPAGEMISFRVNDEPGTEAKGLRLYAGLRLDPFFIDLPGVQATEKLRRLAYRLYPLLSFIIMLLVTFIVMIPLLGRVLGLAHVAGPTRLLFFLGVYVIYGVLYFVTTFFNVALANSIAAWLEGDDPRLSRGVLVAFQRSGPIIRYTLVSATLGLVSVVAKVLVNPFFGGVIMPLIGKRLWLRWRQLSYNIPLLMAVPVIALDQPVPNRNIFKRGGRLVKETWGEQVEPAHSIGLLALLVLLPIILLVAMPALHQGVAEYNPGLVRLGSSVLLVSILSYTQLSALVNAIFALAAYRYATAGKSDLFPGDSSYAEQAFVKSKQTTVEDDSLAASISNSPPAVADDPSN